MNGRNSPPFVTVKERIGRISSNIVPYFKILAGSEPVLETVAGNLRSSMLVTLVASPDKESLRLVSLLYRLPKPERTRLKVIKGVSML